MLLAEVPLYIAKAIPRRTHHGPSWAQVAPTFDQAPLIAEVKLRSRVTLTGGRQLRRLWPLDSDSVVGEREMGPPGRRRKGFAPRPASFLGRKRFPMD